jgi:(1->4)-alpha-D-glucan 1-alpha-D-glucosylmutase
LPDFRRFQSRIAFHGALNSLAQVLLKIASPGNPDFYQGLELWDFSMTDPDNRRPVDFQRRAGLLESLQRPGPQHLQLASLLHNWTDGRIKLFLTARALEFRRSHPQLFLEGDYTPLYTSGKMLPHVCAFMRGYKREKVLVAVPRFTTALTERGRFPLGLSIWRKTSLQLPRAAARSWTNVLTGERVQPRSRSNHILLRDLFNQFPVALLYSS